MKRIAMDLGLGLIVYLAVYICAILIAFIFRDPFTGPGFGERIGSMNYEFLITAIPALLITMGITWISRIKLRSDALRKSIVWTILILLIDMVFAVINAVDVGEFSWSTLDKTFVNSLCCWGYYILLAAVFAGPLLYSKIKQLK